MQHQWNVIGHQKQVQYLQKCIQNGKINHAYLFYGPPHLGKKRVTESFMFSLFCSAQSTEKPCGKCKGCEQIRKNIHPDVFWLEPEPDKQHISVKQVRSLIGKLSKKALHQGYKVAIIKQAATMTDAAANALLKTLEEPAAKTVLILLSESLEQLPATIISRCQNLRFLPVPQDIINEYLVQQEITREQALIITRLANGRPGRANYYLEHKKAIQQEQEKYKLFTELFIQPGALNKKIKQVEKLAKDKNLSTFFDLGITLLRDHLLKQHNLNNYLTHPIEKEITDINQIKQLLKNIVEAKTLLQQKVQAKLILENLIIKLYV